jgi:hypothetical protein
MFCCSAAAACCSVNHAAAAFLLYHTNRSQQQLHHSHHSHDNIASQLQTMRLPATERQMFIARHMAPYAPSYVVHQSSTALMYRQAAENLLQALLTANFSRSTAQLSKAALKAEASAAAAAAAAAVSGVQQASGDIVGRDEVLPARKALVDDLDAQFEAGLKPKHTWLVIRGNELLLDLMSGSYLWLKPVQPEVSAAAAAAAKDGPAAAGAAAAGIAKTAAAVVGSLEAAAAAAEDGLATLVDDAAGHAAEEQFSGVPEAASPAAAAEIPAVRRGRGRPRKLSSSDVGDLSAAGFGTSSAAAAARRQQLDPSALYELFLELPDGSMHAVAIPSTATALLAAFSARRTSLAASPSSSSSRGAKPLPLPAAGRTLAASPGSSSSSRGAKPLPLPAALAKAERLAALLVTQQHAFLSREDAVRLAGMVGGWKVPSLASEQHMAMPASECNRIVCCVAPCAAE